jgi:hypothetical protein
MVIGQAKHVNTGLFDPVDARRGFAEIRAGLEDGRLLLDQWAFQIRDGEVSLLKLAEQVMEETFGVAAQKVRPIAFDGADIRAEEEEGHGKKLKAESRNGRTKRKTENTTEI